MNSYFINILKGINLALTECEFPDKLKKSQVVPLYERQDPLRKESYCPVSLLRHESKFYDGCYPRTLTIEHFPFIYFKFLLNNQCFRGLEETNRYSCKKKLT